MEENFNFSNSLAKLQDIVEIIENENIDIDKALKYYEEGLKISKSIFEKLEKTEMKIMILKDNIEFQDFDEEEKKNGDEENILKNNESTNQDKKKNYLENESSGKNENLDLFKDFEDR